MIVTKTPLRVSLAGGGTDLPAYYGNRGIGEVISLSINRYIYITSSKYHDPDATSFKYSEVEVVSRHENLKNPIVKEVLTHFDLPRGFEFSSLSEVPGGTGLGSSSAFTVGLVSNVAMMLGRPLSQHDAAELACFIELEKLGEPIGKQDQYGCAVGGLKRIEFRNQGVTTSSLSLSNDSLSRLSDRLALVRVGAVRSASEILKEVQSRPQVNFAKLDAIRDLVAPVKSCLMTGDIKGLGAALDENWRLKKTLNAGVSNKIIDDLYDAFVPKFAYGGKLLGAGGSGFLCLILREPLREQRAGPCSMAEPLNIDMDGVRSWSI